MCTKLILLVFLNCDLIGQRLFILFESTFHITDNICAFLCQQLKILPKIWSPTRRSGINWRLKPNLCVVTVYWVLCGLELHVIFLKIMFYTTCVTVEHVLMRDRHFIDSWWLEWHVIWFVIRMGHYIWHCMQVCKKQYRLPLII